MGGAIDCTSNAGEGSTFRFSVVVRVYRDGNGESELSSLVNGAYGATSTTEMTATPAPTLGDCSCEEGPALCIAQEGNLVSEGGVHVAPTCVLGQGQQQRASRRPSAQERWVPCAAVVDPDDGGKQDDETAPYTQASGSSLCGTNDMPSAVVAATEDIWFAGVQAAEGRQQRTNGGSSPGRSVAAVFDQPRFLVVDDIRVNRLVACKMLEALDAEVELMEDGAKAVEACRKSKFSMILMDVMMPVMGGIEATRVIPKGEDGQAFSRNQTIPIVAVTANPTVEGSAEGKEAAFTDVSIVECV